MRELEAWVVARGLGQQREAGGLVMVTTHARLHREL